MGLINLKQMVLWSLVTYHTPCGRCSESLLAEVEIHPDGTSSNVTVACMICDYQVEEKNESRRQAILVALSRWSEEPQERLDADEAAEGRLGGVRLERFGV